jgi:hypothetical protein
MQNYFSVGVDAEVALRFDAARAAAPEKFKSAVSNKIKYGAPQLLTSLCGHSRARIPPGLTRSHPGR